MRGLEKRWLVGLMFLTAAIGLAAFFLPRLASGNESSDDKTIIRGGGTTIALHAERLGGAVTGSFECLALAPEAGTGSKSAQFTVNAMYVTGQITGATVHGDTA